MRRVHLRIPAAALVPLVVAAAIWAADDQFAFMPDGGRTILAGLLDGVAQDAAQDVLTRKADTEGWASWATSLGQDLDDTAIQTVAGYAALNLPLEAEALPGLTGSELLGALPPDGKDLAIAQCQFCHSLFTGYLMHDRDKTGWESTFKAPFHTEIPMNDTERETFSSYSAINMPLDFDDVPPELRF
ncbi:MAG: hypothetical protein ACX93P_08370 [Roseovarius sp.]